MKIRFVLNIFFVLLLTVCTVSALHFYYLRDERLRLIDQEIETTASALISSDVSRIPLDDFEESEDHLHEVLGTHKMSKIIFLKDKNGNVIYENANAQFIPEEIPVESGWQTRRIGKHEVRLLSVLIPSLKQTLQVGVLVEREFLYWRHVDIRFVFYCGAITIGLLIISILLSSLLLSPLRQLALFLDHVAKEFGRGTGQIRPLDGVIPDFGGTDEFSRLIESVKRLSDLIRLNLSTFQSWTALMAHEIKTPLTIIQNLIEGSQKEKKTSGEIVSKDREILQEVNRLNLLLNSFLDWASVENSPATVSEIHAIRLEKRVKQVVERMQNLDLGRVEFISKGDVVVFANPAHVDQLVINLISNALKYSPKSEKVLVKLEDSLLSVEDKGPGIPPLVLERLGQPFNFHRQGEIKGSGLGLAWVNTVCKKYGWKLNVIRDSVFHKVQVTVGA